MYMRTLPQSTLGKVAVILIVLMFVLLVAGTSSVQLYDGVAAGESIVADISARPILALTMLAGFVSGLASFVLGLLSVIKYKDHSILIYATLTVGAILIVFLAGEVISPH